jgi:hypothetical protein
MKVLDELGHRDCRSGLLGVMWHQQNGTFVERRVGTHSTYTIPIVPIIPRRIIRADVDRDDRFVGQIFAGGLF